MTPPRPKIADEALVADIHACIPRLSREVGIRLNFTEAVTVLLRRAVDTVKGDDNDELCLHQERTGPVDRRLLPARRQVGTGKRPRQPVRGC